MGHSYRVQCHLSFKVIQLSFKRPYSTCYKRGDKSSDDPCTPALPKRQQVRQYFMTSPVQYA
uniref:Uncharacterized protein n=1 Tax=Anguilla anguilla TaxID=7936 RepID=A0A0E9RGB4_ANGAN